MHLSIQPKQAPAGMSAGPRPKLERGFQSSKGFRAKIFLRASLGLPCSVLPAEGFSVLRLQVFSRGPSPTPGPHAHPAVGQYVLLQRRGLGWRPQAFLYRKCLCTAVSCQEGDTCWPSSPPLGLVFPPSSEKTAWAQSTLSKLS